jgi:hypothetical protein
MKARASTKAIWEEGKKCGKNMVNKLVLYI